jgi:Right handed beta helix region
MKSHLFGLALLSAIAVGASAPAQAQNGTLTRSFVSSAGVDTNPCTITAPCATFAQAYTKIGANGIIAALDPGKYGPINITSSVTVNGNGWAAITGPAGNDAVTVNAPGDNVILTGLEIDGAGTGAEGIYFEAGASLNVRNCVIQNFNLIGIDFSPRFASHLSVLDTLVSDNGINGIQISPNGSALVVGIISRVTMEKNGSSGLVLTTPGDGAIQVTVSDSISEDNTSDGLAASASGGTAQMMVRNSTIANNSANGLEADYPGATIWFSRTTITGNGTGWLEYMSGVLTTFGTNEIVGNNNVNKAPSSSVDLE